MTFYHECLGGELEMQKISESPMAVQLPSEAGANILHSALVNDKMVLMGSDMLGGEVVKGNDISLCLNCQDEHEIERFFKNLSRDGRVRTPLHQTFWGSTSGELTDKFGVHWLLNYSKVQEP